MTNSSGSWSGVTFWLALGLATAAGCSGASSNDDSDSLSSGACAGSCGGDLPRCDSSRDQCVECLSDADCSPGDACDLLRMDCEHTCTTDADCGGGAPSCDASRGLCAECLADADCLDADEPLCVAGECSECDDDSDCSPGETCDVVDGDCDEPIVSCATDADCSGEDPACDPATSRCVECTGDEHCSEPDKPGCRLSTHQCEECSNDDHCEPGQTCNAGEGRCE